MQTSTVMAFLVDVCHVQPNSSSRLAPVVVQSRSLCTPPYIYYIMPFTHSFIVSEKLPFYDLFIFTQWYCRFCSSVIGDRDSFEPLPSQHSCSYKVRLEDVGRSLRCECIVTDVFGRSSELAYAETAAVLPGLLLYTCNKLT